MTCPDAPRRQLAVDLVGELEAVDHELKELTKQLPSEVLSSGSHPAGVAGILADVGDLARCPDRAHFASCTGHRTERRLVW